jgi:hypothetical protein
VHINKEPFLLRMLPATLEEFQNILVTMMVAQRYPDPTIDEFGVSGWRVIIPKQARVQRNPQLALTQHHKAAKCSNGVGIKVD